MSGRELERKYNRALSELYVKDDGEYIPAFEASNWLPRDCNLTDCYEEFYTFDEETSEYAVDVGAFKNLYDLEIELFGENYDYEEYGFRMR